MPVPTRDAQNRAEQAPTRCSGELIMTKDDSRTARQAAYRRDEVAAARIGHQPDMRERTVAGAHRADYSAAMSDPETRLNTVTATMARALRTAGRAEDAATLIAVSKTRDADDIVPLIVAGQRDFGENRVQEAQAKWPDLSARHPGIRLHLVGQLQSNKAAEAIALFDVIHSLDRLSLVKAIGRAQRDSDRRPICFLQVNIGDEAQKGGCAVADMPALLDAARAEAIEVVGLMAVPPAACEPAPYFALLAKLARDVGLEELSMGMSGDFETALKIGATHIRVGTALFGARAQVG